MEFSKRLESCGKSEFRFGKMPIIPLISKKKDGYSCGSTMLPKPVEKKYSALKALKPFKTFKTKTELKCKIINLPGTVYNEITKIPEFHVLMAIVDTKTKHVMYTELFPCRYDVSVEMLFLFFI